MFRTLVAASVLIVGALAAAQPAHAIVITLDDDSLTVVRPLSGTTQVDFTGHIDITDGYRLSLAFRRPVYNELGQSLELTLVPEVTFRLEGVLFSLIVSSTDALGNYAFANPPFELTSIGYIECPAEAGLCNTGSISYSLNVIAAAAVSEPSTLALVVLGLAGTGVVLRRRLYRRGLAHERCD